MFSVVRHSEVIHSWLEREYDLIDQMIQGARPKSYPSEDISLNEQLERSRRSLRANLQLSSAAASRTKQPGESLIGEARNSVFIVHGLTADDIGGEKAIADELKPRARQNVIFELGFFLGALGRSRVCALYEDGVELPSDYQGIVYVKLDAGGAWRLALGKELRAAGLQFDFNKLA